MAFFRITTRGSIGSKPGEHGVSWPYGASRFSHFIHTWGSHFDVRVGSGAKRCITTPAHTLALPDCGQVHLFRPQLAYDPGSFPTWMRLLAYGCFSLSPISASCETLGQNLAAVVCKKGRSCESNKTKNILSARHFTGNLPPFFDRYGWSPISPHFLSFGGINLEDIAMPKCFRILDTLRREIGALRQELMESGQVPSSAEDDNYRLATQIDLLVNKFLRLQESLGEKTSLFSGDSLRPDGS